MPKVKPLTENERLDKAIAEQVSGKMHTARMSRQDMALALGISVPTLYRRMDNPEELTLREIRIMRRMFPGIVIE